MQSRSLFLRLISLISRQLVNKSIQLIKISYILKKKHLVQFMEIWQLTQYTTLKFFIGQDKFLNLPLNLELYNLENNLLKNNMFVHPSNFKYEE